MKNWKVLDPTSVSNIRLETILSENDIVDCFWSFYCKQIANKYGGTRIPSKQDCIDDFVCVHFAQQTTEKPSSKIVMKSHYFE